MNFAPTDEQKMVREMVRKFAETQIKPIAAELDRTHRHPEEICRQLGEMGLMGVAVPTEYDGAGMDNVTYVMALIEISKACASCGVIASTGKVIVSTIFDNDALSVAALSFSARWINSFVTG